MFRITPTAPLPPENARRTASESPEQSLSYPDRQRYNAVPAAATDRSHRLRLLSHPAGSPCRSCQNHIGAGERIASSHDIFAETWPFNTVSNRIAGKPCDILKPYRRRIQRLPVYSVFILTMKRETATIQLYKPHLICDKSIFSIYVLFHS